MSKQPVSIIVLVHNNLEDTAECFDALVGNTFDFELIVVDNASTDGTPEYLHALTAELPLRVITNDSNAGYARGCNQAVAAASHELVCLLNNDTVPFAGWLEAMVDTLAEGVGCVGAKLLYPDGTIQHAGIVFEMIGEPDPLLLPVHRLRNESDPAEANVVEDMAAVTAACLLTTRSVWEQVGGMDEGYAAAYYEDVDFCLKVREAGYRIVYQPAATLIHKEWGTTKQLTGGPSDPMLNFASNQERYLDRWLEKLEAGLRYA